MHVDIAMSANMHLGECHGVLCSSELAHGTNRPLEWRRHGDSIGCEASSYSSCRCSVTCTCAWSGSGSVRRDSQDKNTQDMLPNRWKVDPRACPEKWLIGHEEFLDSCEIASQA